MQFEIIAIVLLLLIVAVLLQSTNISCLILGVLVVMLITTKL